MDGVYLIHFDRPLAHAQHYLGWAADIDQRIEQHRAGRGSALMAAVTAAGIDWRLARVWNSADRTFERQLKRRHETPRLCPLCVAAGVTNGRGLLLVEPEAALA